MIIVVRTKGSLGRSLSDEVLLTCNWHNWKFDLTTGENQYGGDKLRYPVAIRGEDIWLIRGPGVCGRYAQVMQNLREAFLDHSYDRIARGLLDCGLSAVIRWTPPGRRSTGLTKLEFGWTHATPGWPIGWCCMTRIRATRRHAVSLVEALGHAAFDSLREADIHYDVMPFSDAGFLKAIEHEDERAAIGMIRGALKLDSRLLIWKKRCPGRRLRTTTRLTFPYLRDQSQTLIARLVIRSRNRYCRSSVSLSLPRAEQDSGVPALSR